MHREIPRSYVYFLESRVSYLESLLEDNSIPFALPEAFQAGAKSRSPQASGHVPASTTDVRPDHERSTAGPLVRAETSDTWDGEENDAEKVNKLVSNIGMVSVHGVSNPRYLGSTSGISFARIVFAAIKSSIPSASSERNGSQGSRPSANGSGDRSMRESFFGLQVRPTIKQAPFPNKDLGLRLVNLYFDHANPQMPILHKGEFMTLFDKVYTSEERNGTPRDLYMLNIVFAIGAGTTLEDIDSSNSPDFTQSAFATKNDPTNPSNKRQRLSTRQHQPEEYHASAIVHLESFLGSSQAADRADGFGGGLEELQAVLLLAGFALLRPVAPGLWYIVGVAVRLAVDLGLHYEDGTDVESERDGPDIAMADPVATDDAINSQRNHRIINAKERGRREWIRDLRRRLWWCVYSFDRLVSVCVGRPFGITDQVITTDFPSLLDDCYITPAGFLAPPENLETSSYKVVAHHYFRFRLLQSEILQVLQYQQVQQVRQVRACDNTKVDEYMLNKLPSPFLLGFDSFRLWRKDINRRLREWKDSAPLQQNIDVRFSVLFFELNYWQAVIMLYRQSLSVPPRLADGLSLTDDVSDPSTVRPETLEDEDDIFLRVAEAGQKVLRIYRQLHRLRLVNYTFLATHHLFMAGTDPFVHFRDDLLMTRRDCVPLRHLALLRGSQ